MQNNDMIEEKAKFPLKGRLRVELFGADGKLKDYREISNTFMDTGDAHVADQLAAVPGEAAMGWMAIGTSATANAVTDTTLNKELDRNALAAGYPEQGAAADDNKVKYKATWAADDGTGALTEAGVFNSSAAGSLLCASTFPVINKGASDTLTITWTVTCG
jgi:hypothetical protein